MREDENLTPDQLEDLWNRDANRALLEWTYRMLVTPASVGNPYSFAEYLIEQYKKKKSMETSLDAKIGYLHLLGVTEQLKNGDKTLNDWVEVIRSVTKGQRIKDKKMIQKIDPELRHAVKNLANRGAKKNTLK